MAESNTLQGYVLPHAADLSEADLLEKVNQLAPAGCGLSQAVLRLFKDRNQYKALIGRMVHDLQLTVDLYEGHVKKPATIPAPAEPREACPRCGAVVVNWQLVNPAGDGYLPARACIRYDGGKCGHVVLDKRPDLTPPPPVVETPAPLVPGDGCYKAG